MRGWPRAARGGRGGARRVWVGSRVVQRARLGGLGSEEWLEMRAGANGWAIEGTQSGYAVLTRPRSGR